MIQLTDLQLRTLQEMIRIRARILSRQRWYFDLHDEEDIAQELFLRVWKRLKRFNAARSSWEAFCSMILSQGILNLIHRELSPKRKRLKTKSMAPVELESVQISADRTDSDWRGQWELETDVAYFLEGLLAQEQAIAKALMQSKKSEVQKLFGLSRRQFARIQRKLLAAMSELELMPN